MLQVRKLVLAVAAASALSTGAAHAISLGDVSVKSYLGQPLEAEIELTDIKGLDTTEVKSQLASLEEFSRHGVERQFFLSNIKFTPVINHSGKSYIRVTSERAVNEPYVSFLLELFWPNGRALREYTLLIDPPMYSPQDVQFDTQNAQQETKQPAAQQQQPVTKPAPQPVKQPAQASTPERKAAPVSRPASKPVARDLSSGAQHRVVKNESLWSIASRVSGDGDIYQKMIAIVEQNPQAFIGGDINKLKADAILNLPSDEQIRSIAKRDAVAKFQDFQARPIAQSAGQLDARQLERADAAPASVRSEDNLRLLSSQSGESQTGGDRGASSRDEQRLIAELAESKELLDSVQLENADLRERVQELNEQLERLQKLVELKNTQLANLQNMDAAQLQEQQLEEPEQQAEEIIEPSQELAAEQELSSEQQVAESVQEETPAEAEPVQTAEVEQEQPVAVKPVIPAFEDEFYDKSFLDEMLDNPLFLPAAGGGVLVALVLLLLMSRKRKAAKEAAELEAENLAYEQENPYADMGEDTVQLDEITSGVDAVNLDDFDTELPEVAQEQPEQNFKEEKADGGILAEVEGYVAYGRFNEAASKLMQAIDIEPERADLRLKLMEVFADLDDRNGFARQVTELEEMGGNQSALAEMKNRFPHMFSEPGASLSAEAPDLDSIGLGLDGLDAPQAADQLDENAIDDDILSGLDLTDFGLDDQPSAETQPLAETADEDTFELPDFEQETTPAEPEPEQELDELSLTLNELDGMGGLDADLTDTGSSSENSLELDDGLDFGSLDELATVDVAAEPEPISEADDSGLEFSADLDLSLPHIDEPIADADDELQADFAALNEELDDLAQSLTPEAATDDDLDSLLEEADELGSDFNLGSLDADLNIDEIKLDSDFDELTRGAATAEDNGLDLDADITDLSELSELSDLDGFDELTDSLSDEPRSELEESLGDDFDFLAGTDETTTKLDLARAYVEMGDSDGAKDILEEVMSEGNDEQKEQAQELIKRLG